VPKHLHFIPNTGIQYFDLGWVDQEQLHRFRFDFERQGSKARFRKPDDVRDDTEEVIDDPGEDDYRKESATPEFIAMAAHGLGGLWIPLPMDREGAWVALHLRQCRPAEEKAAMGQSAGKPKPRPYRAFLAVDTTLQQDGNPQGMDCGETGSRTFRPCSRRFWALEVVDQFVGQLKGQLEPLQRAGKIGSGDADRIRHSMLALAEFLRVACGGGILLHSAARPHRETAPPVGVDMALDLGNSRTCVILQESGGERRSTKLQLVYPEDPSRVEQCPFETQFVFVEHSVLSPRLRGRESFRLLSPIQLGPTAVERLRLTKFDPRQFGLNSPKRYLWDTRFAVDWNWALIDQVDAQGRPERISADLLSRMEPGNPLQDPGAPGPPPQPNYPRIAGTVWVIVELLEQAFRQMNDAAWRGADQNLPHHGARREIQNLAITYPAGMHGEELAHLRKACERACRLWTEFRTNPDSFSKGEGVSEDRDHGMPRPKVHLVCDEGLAIHACWLRMALSSYENKASELLGALGRKRGEDAEPRLRVASIDIGGGTIDLAIAEYREDPGRRGQAALGCRRLFHSGISRAGDDIVRCVLERLVFPRCLAECRRFGLDRLQWNKVFAQQHADNVAVQHLRRRSLRSVWRPVASHILEVVDNASFGKFPQAIKDFPGVDPQVLLELEKMLNLPHDALGNVQIVAEFRDICDIVRQAIGVTLDQCCDVIDQFDCDVLVVAGKPSSNNAVRRQLLGCMPVPPGQVIFLADMPLADWYPFHGVDGRIADAKTCGVVGCMVAFEAMRGTTSFALAFDAQREPSKNAQPIVGVIANHEDPSLLRVSESGRFDDQGRLDWSVQPFVGVRIASRRINHDDAEASPIFRYRIRPGPRARAGQIGAAVAHIRVQFELKLTEPPRLPRMPIEIGTAPTLDSIIDPPSADSIDLGNGGLPAAQVMVLELNTLMDADGYWLDTGRFSPIEELV
jgi:hypothetical protein